MAKITMHWDGAKAAKMSRDVGQLDDRLRRVITGTFDWHQDKAVEYAKTHAPWTDRTGAARSGLFATTAIGTNRDHWELIVSHAVYYGIYLEVCNSGKYAIIMPTVRHIGDQLIKNLSHVLDRMEAEK